MVSMCIWCCSWAVKAQCPTEFQNHSALLCVAYCATGTCQGNVELRTPAFNVNDCGVIADPDWVLDSHLAEVSRGTTQVSGGTEYWIIVRSAAGSFCPGRVTFKWRKPLEDCGEEFLIGNQISKFVHKSFNKAALDARAALDGNGSFRIWTNTPACAIPGDDIALAVTGYHQCFANPNIPTTAANGFDGVKWSIPSSWTEGYRSQDQTSIVVRPPGTYNNTVNILVRLGQCNVDVNPAHAVATFTPRSPAMAIKVVDEQKGGLFNITDGTINSANPTVGTTGEACLSSRSAAPFRLRLLTQGNFTGGADVKWEAPLGYNITVIPPGQNNGMAEAVITPATGSATSSGDIIAYNTAGQCGRTLARFRIFRTLDATNNHNSIAVLQTDGFGFPAVTPNATTHPPQCFYPDINYEFRLSNLPAGTPISWGFPASDPTWINVQGQGSAILRANTSFAPESGTPPVLPLSVSTTTLPCTSTIQISRLKATSLDFDMSDSPQPLRILRSGTGGQTVTITDDLNNDAWFYNCGQTVLSAADFHYIWSFEGTFTPLSGPACTQNCNVFTSNPVGTGLNSMTLLPGTYNGTLRCRVRKTSTVTACDGSNRCFYVMLELPISETINSPIPGGNGQSSSKTPGGNQQ